ncbi:TonB-dependent receptor [Novosphingobium sp. FSW06-99]|uniref:TonB-dependent receptor n=1 Tax=Novosphingobium sp. FSW06-99 TaxID=1739113 RepID=UPI000AA4DFCF|nr:TonB-dependent receptor [Novosphingobium sp. FSW06-99]
MKRQYLARVFARSASASAMIVAGLAGNPLLAQSAAQPAPAATGTAPASAAPATKPAEDVTNAIIVSGYRASLRSAINTKRNSDLLLESIAPEDIGKFPDQNVAESLQRLPGVQIDRSNGQGTSVLIDGLRQNATLLNGEVFLTGREFYVSGEASGGGAGANSQYASLEGVPSEEIGGIDVYKNPQASTVEGGIGGTINLKGIDPLAQKQGLTIAGNLRGTVSSGAKKVTPDGTLFVSYKVSDNFAAFAAVSYDHEKTLTDTFQDANRNQWLITDYVTTPQFGPNGGGLTAASFAPGSKNYLIPQLAYFTNDNDDRKIFGASAGFNAKLSDDLSLSFVWFHSHEDDTDIQYSDKVWFNGQGASAGTPSSPGTALPALLAGSPSSIDSNGVVQSGSFYANGAETATLYQNTTAHADNYQAKLKFDNKEGLRLNFGGAYSKAASDLEADQADVEHGQYNSYATGLPTTSAPGCNTGASTCATGGTPGYSFNWANGGTSGLPSVSYNSNVLNNPNYTLFKSNWAWANKTDQSAWDVHFDAAWDVRPGITIEAGARGAGRDVQQIFGRYLITSPDGSPINTSIATGGGNYVYYLDPGYAGLPYSTALSNPNLAMNVNNFGAGSITVKNPYTGGMTNPSTYLETVWSGGGGGTNTTEKFFEDTLSSFEVNSKTTAAYLMTDIGEKSSAYHLNVGVRFVSTWLDINNAQTAPVPTFYGTASWNGVNNNNVPVTTDRQYNDVLPSLNFEYKLGDHQIIRLGAAKVMSPQDLFSLGLGNTFNFTRQVGSRTNVNTGVADGFAFAGGSSGNTQLDPYRAWQGVADYENYFAPGSMISVAAFYKKVLNFVETLNVPTLVNDDFGGTVADVTKPENAGSGYIYGLELSAQWQARDGILQGFGLAGNYTRSESSASLPTSFTTNAPIPGVAKNAFTLNGFYESHGFSARLSYSWRDKSINDSAAGATFAFNNQIGVSQTYEVFSAPYGQLDGQIGYDVNRNFGLVFSAQNLTKTAQHTYLQWPNEPFTYFNSGHRFFFGAKFKY